MRLALVLMLIVACGSPEGGDPGSDAGPARGSARPVESFVDVTESMGIDFRHTNGASERRYLPETMGSGVAFFDYDGDGYPDLYFVNGMAVEGTRGEGEPGVLYRNLGGRRFERIPSSGALSQVFNGMGAAVGDVDNDGDLDLFVSAVGPDRLFLSSGTGAFVDATEVAGVGEVGFGTSAAFLDHDADGWLDLFVARYVEWSPTTDIPCTPDGEHRTYCTPEVYRGQNSLLYRNLGGGTFRNVTRSAGVFRPEGKSLGVVSLDYDDDGWADLAVANDTVRNFLFVNNRTGGFREVAVEAGVAYSESGATRGGMGIDAADLSGDGRPEIVIGNFSQEMAGLYRAVSGGLYSDEAAQAGVGLPSLMTLAFGTLILDFDSDGYLDVVLANGHIEPDIARFQPLQSYRQPVQLFRRDPESWRFELAGAGPEEPLAAGWVGRGLAAADYDLDGDLDLVLTQNGDSGRLFSNETGARSWLRLKLVGRRSNRDGYGARVTAVTGERRLVRALVSGRSYLSASEPILTLGLGRTEHLDRLEVRWPSGARQVLVRPPLNCQLRLHEPAHVPEAGRRAKRPTRADVPSQ